MAQHPQSRRQVGFLLSKGSPLTGTQKTKLKRELHTGKVKVTVKKKKRPRMPR